MSLDLAHLDEPDGLEPFRSRNGLTVEDIQRGLIYLALAGGNTVTAHQRLQEDGYDQPAESTLRLWRSTSYPRRYNHYATKYAQDVEATLIIQARETAHMAAELTKRALARAEQGIDKASPTDAAKIAQQSSVAMGIHIDKALLLDGRPTHITEQRDATQITTSLAQRLGLHIDAETTAQEEPTPHSGSLACRTFVNASVQKA